MRSLTVTNDHFSPPVVSLTGDNLLWCRSAPCVDNYLHSYGGAAHRNLKLPVGESCGDGTLGATMALTHASDVPRLVGDVSSALVTIGAAAVGADGRPLTRVLKPQPVVLEKKGVHMVCA